ncbi:uncharacterized protein LOC106472578 isoform X2 [Limulus polyphemus]|nr:uncharacterized protein LOC106472578 isoform X2 [Limulus polyphemus]XP_022256846.1 uncharacterized protein LOC106472578 isoform X2 [Limulus polyphemus]
MKHNSAVRSILFILFMNGLICDCFEGENEIPETCSQDETKEIDLCKENYERLAKKLAPRKENLNVSERKAFCSALADLRNCLQKKRVKKTVSCLSEDGITKGTQGEMENFNMKCSSVKLSVSCFFVLGTIVITLFFYKR